MKRSRSFNCREAQFNLTSNRVNAGSFLIVVEQLKTLEFHHTDLSPYDQID
jgi:hypothetical protein